MLATGDEDDDKLIVRDKAGKKRESAFCREKVPLLRNDTLCRVRKDSVSAPPVSGAGVTDWTTHNHFFLERQSNQRQEGTVCLPAATAAPPVDCLSSVINHAFSSMN